MQRVSLIVYRLPQDDQTLNRLEIREHVDLSRFSNSVRSSPVFSFAQEEGNLPSLDQKYFCKFFYINEFCSAAARVPIHLRDQVWFSLGLASIVVITNEIQILDEVTDSIADWTLATETWTVDNGVIVKDQDDKNHDLTKEIAPGDFLIEYDAGIPGDIATVISELNHNFHECASKAAILSPDFLATLFEASERVRFLSDEIHVLHEGLLGKISPSVSPLDTQKLINQHVDQLISINSTLAYVISQAFYGTTPILTRNGCLVRHHSLLGVGSAHKSLRNLVGYIEAGFLKYPALKAAETLYLKPNHSRLDHLGELSFASPLETIDDYLNANPTLSDSSYPKLPYFSSRYGFSEAPGIVTAAMQVLAGADSTRWSFLTITHEMMHAYFEAICAQIMADADAEDPLGSILEMGQALSNAGEELSKDFKNPFEAIKAQAIYLSSLIRSARDNRSEIESSWQTDGELKYEGYSAGSGNEYLSDLVNTRKIIEECVVHSLDLFYFYQGRRQRYLAALWLSWSTVPGVVENLEFYILRSLVCIGYDLQGPIMPNRFDAAVSMLIHELDEIKESDGTPALLIIEKTIQFLRDPKNLDLLAPMFEPLCQFVGSIRQCFFSENLRVYFEASDPLVVAGDIEPEYALETGELFGDLVVNPIAFLSDRLRRSIISEPQSLCEEYRSAWAVLMLGP